MVTDAAVNFLEGRTKKMPKTILIELGLVDKSNDASYQFNTSIAPEAYAPVLSYHPEGEK